MIKPMKNFDPPCTLNGWTASSNGRSCWEQVFDGYTDMPSNQGYCYTVDAFGNWVPDRKFSGIKWNKWDGTGPTPPI